MFYFVLYCVLVGLDWAKPMMNYFYMSHVHAFSWIHTFNSIYIDISTAWYFFDVSFSFFLSLSPLVSYVMAPKRKSTISRNLLYSRWSSSSSPFDPTPSHIWFCDEMAKSNFFENFSRCGIHSERQVILSDFSNTNLPIVIYNILLGVTM